MTARTSEVNLLPTDRFEFSPWGRFLMWALSTGRLVVILTELVVIIAFLSRFWFDRRLDDLRQLRIQRSQVVESLEDVRIRWEQMLWSTEAIGQMMIRQYDAADRLDQIQSLSPSGVMYDSIEISSSSAALVGFVPNSEIFAQLYSRMKADQGYKKVEVGRLEQSADRFPGFVFEMVLWNKTETEAQPAND